MEDYAIYLSEETKSEIVVLHQFKILYEPEQNACHFFFEGGEDSLFFMPEARRHINDKRAHIYDCGGKRNVVAVRDSIKSEGYNVEVCLFFVDRDFDDYLKTQVDVDDYTYITDHYSIENEISTPKAAQILLEDVVGLSRANPAFGQIELSLASGFRAFYREIRPLMAWILAAKESNCAPNLRNTNGLKGIVTLKGTQPTLTPAGFAKFKRSVVVKGRLPPDSSVRKWTRKLRLSSCKFWVRGKYDIWFFQNALLAALEEANAGMKAAGGRRLRIPRSLRDGRIFEMLGGRVPPPESLRAFFAVRLQ